MGTAEADRVLHVWTVSELALYGVVIAYLAMDLRAPSLGPRALLLAGIVVLTLQILFPVVVAIDVWRTDGSSPVWVHATALPALGFLSFLAYLGERRRIRSDPEP